MSGYVYHIRPRSNERFCKIGMTNGRDVENRLNELNSSTYAGFSDWDLVSVALVEDPQVVEKSFHNKYSSNKAPMGQEQEVFVIDREEVERDFAKYKTVSFEIYDSLEQKYEALKEKSDMLVKENNRLREGDITRKEHRRLLKLLQMYTARFGEIEQ